MQACDAGHIGMNCDPAGLMCLQFLFLCIFRHAEKPVQHWRSEPITGRTQQVRGGCGDTSKQLRAAASGSGAQEPTTGKQAAISKPSFSGRLAAIPALRWQQSSGGACQPAVTSDCASGAIRSVGSSPLGAASSTAQRPELSSEQQQLLQRAASSPETALAVDLSAFADVPAIPAWRGTIQTPLEGTLRKTFTLQRTEPTEEVSPDTAEP